MLGEYIESDIEFTVQTRWSWKTFLNADLWALKLPT